MLTGSINGKTEVEMVRNEADFSLLLKNIHKTFLFCSNTKKCNFVFHSY